MTRYNVAFALIVVAAVIVLPFGAAQDRDENASRNRFLGVLKIGDRVTIVPRNDPQSLDGYRVTIYAEELSKAIERLEKSGTDDRYAQEELAYVRNYGGQVTVVGEDYFGVQLTRRDGANFERFIPIGKIAYVTRAVGSN